MVINKNGKMAKILEHSWGDGMTGLYYNQEIHKDVLAKPVVGPNTETEDKDATVNKVGALA